MEKQTSRNVDKARARAAGEPSTAFPRAVERRGRNGDGPEAPGRSYLGDRAWVTHAAPHGPWEDFVFCSELRGGSSQSSEQRTELSQTPVLWEFCGGRWLGSAGAAQPGCGPERVAGGRACHSEAIVPLEGILGLGVWGCASPMWLVMTLRHPPHRSAWNEVGHEPRQSVHVPESSPHPPMTQTHCYAVHMC